MSISLEHNFTQEKLMFLGGSSTIGTIVQNHFRSAFPDIKIYNGTRNPINQMDFYFDLNQEFSIPDGPGEVLIFSFSKLNNFRETEIDTSYQLNVVRTIELLEVLNSKNWRISYISSDAVDNYQHARNYPNLIHIYGHQKMILENFITANYSTSKIIRVSKVFDKGSPTLMNWLKQLNSNKQINVYCNYFFSPITNSFLAAAVLNIFFVDDIKFFRITGKDYLSYSDFFQLLEVRNPFLLDYSLLNIHKSLDDSKFNDISADPVNFKGRYQQDIIEVIDQFKLNYKNYKNIDI